MRFPKVTIAKITKASALKPMEKVLIPGHCTDFLALGVCHNPRCTYRHTSADPSTEQKTSFLKNVKPVLANCSPNKQKNPAS